MIAHATREAEGMIEAVLGVVVEEQAADTARFVSMRQIKVAIAPGLALLVHARPEALTGRSGGEMPVEDVFVERIVRREIEAAAEPPHGGQTSRRRNEEAHIAMRGGCIGVPRMEHQRKAHGL